MEATRLTSVLVTGGAGFIGSAFVRKLLGRVDGEGGGAADGDACARVRLCPRCRVVVLDKLQYCSSMKNLEAAMREHGDRLSFVEGDILDRELVASVLREHAVDAVVHFAAETHVDNAFEGSLEFCMTNVLGTHVLLECCRLAAEAPGAHASCAGGRRPAAVRRFVHVSTDEVYGETDLGEGAAPCAEGTRMNPSNPYAATKAAAEMMALSYQRTYGLPVVITRCNNVYGPAQFPEKLIPKLILRGAGGMSMPVHGDGGQMRTYLFVDDVADAYIRVVERGAVGEVYNIGGTVERTVLSVAKDVRRAMGIERAGVAAAPAGCADAGPAAAANGAAGIEFVEDRISNDRRYLLDYAKVASLGWRPVTSWADGLGATVEWFLSTDVREYWEGAGERMDCALAPHSSQSRVGAGAAVRTRAEKLVQT